jgi:membrane protein
VLLHAHRIYLFWKQVVVHFIDIYGTTRAAALAYTTLFSSVPLAVMGVGILSAFPVFQDYSGKIQNFLISHFVAASADTIQLYLQDFSVKAASLSVSSVVFILIAAVMLIFTMESALNAIWRVQTRRHGATAFMIYWAVLTLLPILAGTGIAVSVYISSLPYFKGATEAIGGVVPLLEMLPFFLSWAAFTTLYIALPNTHVRFRDAVIGAFVAALLFEIGKHVFGYYITNFSTYEIIYGALAAIPIFLVWIYVSWIIILFGAVVTYVRQRHREIKEAQDDTNVAI